MVNKEVQIKNQSFIQALLSSLTVFSFAVMMTIRLRNCWTEAGQCSGSRWPPAGSVSSSTCGPLLLPWSARSALRPRTHITTLESSTLILGLWPSGGSHAEPQDYHSPPLSSNTTLHYPQRLKWRIICCLLFYMLVFLLLCFTMLNC